MTLTGLWRSAYVAPVVALMSCSLSAPAARGSHASDIGTEVAAQALALVGVPYRYGSDDPSLGLDCSGLVRHLFRAVASVQLPHRSEEMSRLGQRVARDEVRAGDLLFFNTLGRPNSHVAVYVGDGRFVHAPTRRGHVRVEGFDERYWRTRFNGARRIEVGPDSAPPSVVAPRGAAGRADETAHEQ